ncbi:hypothetical protein ABZP36_010507 [Zizania latifolia]
MVLRVALAMAGPGRAVAMVELIRFLAVVLMAAAPASAVTNVVHPVIAVGVAIGVIIVRATSMARGDGVAGSSINRKNLLSGFGYLNSQASDT